MCRMIAYIKLAVLFVTKTIECILFIATSSGRANLHLAFKFMMMMMIDDDVIHVHYIAALDIINCEQCYI